METDLDRETFGISCCMPATKSLPWTSSRSVPSTSPLFIPARSSRPLSSAVNAAALILFHKHPSGDLTPSAKDRTITKRMVEDGKLLSISVHDHLKLGARGAYASFQEKGWI